MTETQTAFEQAQEAGRRMREHIHRALLSREKQKPYRDSYRDRPRITPQKLDRKVLAAVREGATTAPKLLQALKDFEAADLRLSVQRLLEARKLSVNEKGEFTRNMKETNPCTEGSRSSA